MFKRVALVLVSLLMLNSCAELFELMGGEIIVEGYSPWSYDIDVYNVDTDSFTLSWDETTYNDGTNGSFYYEVYVVEGYEYDSYSFYNGDLVTSGWDFNSYTVQYLDPNTVYSYVVAVSESMYGSKLYYNVGTVTTNNIVYSTEYIGVWEMTEYGYTSMVLTFYSDSFNFDMYDMYGDYNGSYSGSLDAISSDVVRLTYETETDMYGYQYTYGNYDNQEDYSWYMFYGDLVVTTNGETMTLSPYAGFINPKYDVTPTRVYMTPSYLWYDDSLYSNEIVHYHYSVTPGAQYTIAWNDSHQGNGTKGLDIKVSAWDTEGFYYLSGEDSGYNYPHTITIPDGVYDLTVEVEAWYSGSTGTYAIQVTQVY